MGKLTKKETRIISLALASWGVIMLGSGFTMKSMIKPTEVKKNDLEVVHKRVAEIKTNENICLTDSGFVCFLFQPYFMPFDKKYTHFFANTRFFGLRVFLFCPRMGIITT